jgi:aminoglycoside phosphotransferase
MEHPHPDAMTTARVLTTSDGASARTAATQPPELELLLGPGAGDLLHAVAGTAGGALGPWRPTQVQYQPAGTTQVQFRADIRWPGGATTSETFVAATGRKIPEQDVAVFDDGATRVAVWRWPSDPLLPALRDATDPTAVAALLDDVGIGGGTLQLRTRAYRPGRRAVVEATGRRGRLFLKVVRPDRAQPMHELHRLLSADLPVPDSLGWTDRGVVVLTARPGETLRQALRTADHPAPPPRALTDLLDRLPASLAEGPRRRDPFTAAQRHGVVLAATVPSARGLVDELLGVFESADHADHPVVPVHGDLYESQLLVDRSRITGLIDVDTAGAGHRVDDLANAIAHLSVMGTLSDRPRHYKRYGAELLAHAEQHHDRADLRLRVAAFVLGLATGPFRTLEPGYADRTRRRLELARSWVPTTSGR